MDHVRSPPCFSWDRVGRTAEFLVLLSPDCGLLPELTGPRARSFTPRAFLSMESLRARDGTFLEHCVCLASAAQATWIFDDNLNEMGFQGGKIDESLRPHYVQHYKERVPVAVMAKRLPASPDIRS